MFDTTQIRSANNLITIVERDTRLKRIAGTGGGEFAGPCPFRCGCDHDGFHVQPNAPQGGRWFCRKCTNGEWRDVIQYVMMRDGLDFVEACQALGADSQRAWQPKPRPAAPQLASPALPPTTTWQAQARRAIAECQRALWSQDGERARAWLHQRGLNDTTLERWKLGYLPPASTGWREVAGLRMPCGIVIPGEVDGQPAYIKVRRASGKPKYMHLKGGRPAPYLTASLAGRDVAVLVEGELDALLLWQAGGDLVGVVTLGSASDRVDTIPQFHHLQAMKQIFVAYDCDDAGRSGAAKVVAALSQAKSVKVPQLRSGDKDLTDFHVAGGGLRDWLIYVLRRNGAGDSEGVASARREPEGNEPKEAIRERA